MGRKTLVCAALCSAVLVFSCAGLREREDGKKQISIELPGNPSAGYSWTYTMEPEGILEEVSSSYRGEGGGRTGAGGVFVFVFEGLEPGAVKLHFVYKRPWEDTQPARTGLYTLSVDQDRGIRITEQKAL